MKQIISLLLFLAAGLCFTACEKEEKIDLSTPVLRFSEIVYSLGTTTPLEVRLTSSRPMEQNTTVPFDVQGAAIEGEEYELSAKDFRFATGDTAASITITPKACKEDGKTIKLTLHPVEGFRFGEFNFTLIEIVAEAQVIASFDQSSYTLAQELSVNAYIKNALTGNYYSSHPGNINVPFTIDPKSTAVEGEHFEFINNPNHLITFGPNKSQANFGIRFLKWEDGKNRLYLNVGDNNVIAGNIDQVSILVKGKVPPPSRISRDAGPSPKPFPGITSHKIFGVVTRKKSRTCLVTIPRPIFWNSRRANSSHTCKVTLPTTSGKPPSPSFGKEAFG